MFAMFKRGVIAQQFDVRFVCMGVVMMFAAARRTGTLDQL
jgi:hypothetical protein